MKAANTFHMQPFLHCSFLRKYFLEKNVKKFFSLGQICHERKFCHDQWTLNIPGRITPMIKSMIGWSWRAGKSNFKRTEESSKEWAFFYKLANIGKKFMLFAEMNQYFRVRQDFLFSSNCFTSICSKKVSIFTFIFWKNYKCFDLSKKPLPFN